MNKIVVILKSGQEIYCSSVKEISGILWIRTLDGYVYQLSIKEIKDVKHG